MKILLALDQSRNALAAARWVQGLRLPAGSILYLLHVFELKQWPELYAYGDTQQFLEQLAPFRAKAAAKAQRFISGRAKSFHGQRLKIQANVLEGLPGAEILTAVEQHSIDLVVVGTKGLSGIKRFLLGSVSEWVLSDAPCSVMMVRGQPRWASRKAKGMCVLFATDGSSDAEAAAGFFQAMKFPRLSGITVIHVAVRRNYLADRLNVTDRTNFAQLSEEIRRSREQASTKLLKETERKLKQRGLKVDTLLAKGHAADEILKAAKRIRADLIVVGSRGLTGLRRFLLGSVAHEVARHAPCSVMVVRQSVPNEKTQPVCGKDKISLKTVRKRHQ